MSGGLSVYENDGQVFIPLNNLLRRLHGYPDSKNVSYILTNYQKDAQAAGKEVEEFPELEWKNSNGAACKGRVVTNQKALNWIFERVRKSGMKSILRHCCNCASQAPLVAGKEQAFRALYQQEIDRLPGGPVADKGHTQHRQHVADGQNCSLAAVPGLDRLQGLVFLHDGSISGRASSLAEAQLVVEDVSLHTKSHYVVSSIKRPNPEGYVQRILKCACAGKPSWLVSASKHIFLTPPATPRT